MELKAALQVFNQSAVPTSPGVIEGLTIRKLAGSEEHPSERISVGLATFGPGTHEHLHWHLIETFHYIVAGRGIVRDLEGTSFEVGPGDVVYGPPGIRGAHEWEVRETLTLLTIKATNAPERAIQFTIDRAKQTCSADLDYLLERGAGDMKESFY
jgi:mannose-6-phosphate isomerase-like protein (cupin superfamily)